MPPEEEEQAEATTDLEEPLLPQPTEGGEDSVPAPLDSSGEGHTEATTYSPTGNQEEHQEHARETDNNDGKDVVVSLCGRRCLKLNHNVLLNLLLAILYGMSDSLWTGTVLVAYLKRLGREQNRPVGDIEAVNGLAVLVSALPVGYLADTYGRDVLIRAGGMLFIGTALLHAATMVWIGTDEEALSERQQAVALILLGIVMGLWGIGGGIVSGPAQALYADSTPAGERSIYYHYLFVAYLVSSCLGPIVSIILFQTLGDEWNLYQLRIIIFVGLTMEAGNSVLMMFFDDSKALEEGDGSGAEGASASSEATANTATNHSGEVPTEPEDCQEQGKSGSPSVSTTTVTTEETDLTQSLLAQEEVEPETNENGNAAAAEGQPVSSAQTSPQGKQRLIPYILFFAGLIFSIGSGCTVKFFPLFFKEDVGMSPSQVQIVYVLVPICMALCSGVGTTLAPHLGRVETCLLLQTLGIGCLYAMVFCKSFLDSHPIVLVPVYILRTALMNCTYPLLESILMDFVPKNERARWKSLESVSQFGWCGSAALGGYVSDKWDYTHTFFVTATIQMVGNVFMFSLLPLVPRSEQALATNVVSDPSSNNNEAGSGDTGTQNRIQGSADTEDE